MTPTERLSRIADLIADMRVSDFPHSRLARFAGELYVEIMEWKSGNYPYGQFGKQVVGVARNPNPEGRT